MMFVYMRIYFNKDMVAYTCIYYISNSYQVYAYMEALAENIVVWQIRRMCFCKKIIVFP